MEKFDIDKLLKIISGKKLYLVGIIIIFMCLGYMYSFYYVKPEYKSETNILLTQANTNNGSNGSDQAITQGDLTLNQKLVSTYSEIIKSNKILSSVISNKNLEMTEQQLRSKITVSSIKDTELLKIQVTDANPNKAMEIATEVANVFCKEVVSIYNIDNVYIIDKAQAPTSPYNINHTKDIIIFTGLGVMAGVLLIALVYFFDDTLKREQDIEEFIGLNVLTSIPLYNKEIKNGKAEELITHEEFRSPMSEYFRALRTNLMFTQAENSIKTILVTSVSTSEGKSWISSNLAVAFAQLNKRVLLIDSDMRKGRQHHIFNADCSQGLSNCLLAKNLNIDTISDFIKETQVPNLHIMTGGDRPLNPSELLSSQNMMELLSIAKKVYDIVILDGTPCGLVSDSIILSSIVDTSVIVAASRSSKIKTTKKLRKLIENAGGTIGGVVLNKVEVSAKAYKSTYYYSDKEGKKLEQPEEQQEIITVEQAITQAKKKLKKQSQEEPQKEIEIDKENTDMSELKQEMQLNYDKVSQNIEKNITDLSQQINTINRLVSDFIIQDKVKKESNPELEKITEKIEDLDKTYQDVFSKSIAELVSNYSNEENYSNIIQEIKQAKEEYVSSIQEISQKMNIQVDKNLFTGIEDKIAELSTKMEQGNQQELQQISSEINSAKEVYADIIQKINEKEDTVKNQEIVNQITQSVSELSDKIENANIQDIQHISEQMDRLKNTYEGFLYEIDQKIIQNNSQSILNEVQEKINELAQGKEQNSIETREQMEEMKMLYHDLLNQISQKMDETDNKVMLEAVKDKLEQIAVKVEQNDMLQALQQQNEYEVNLSTKFDQIKEILEKENPTDGKIEELTTEISIIKELYKELIENKENQISQLSNRIQELKDMYNRTLDVINYQNVDDKITKIEHEMAKINQIDTIKSEVSSIRELFKEIKQMRIQDNNHFKKIVNIEELKQEKIAKEEKKPKQVSKISNAQEAIFDIEQDIDYTDLEENAIYVCQLLNEATAEDAI